MKKIFGALVVGLMLAGCSKEGTDGPKAETSVKLDLGDTKESLKKTFNEAEKKLESGAKEARAKLEDAGDKLKDKYEETKDRLDSDKNARVKVEVKKD